MAKRTVACRLEERELALALSGLIKNNHHITSLSELLRTTFYYGILSLHNNDIPEPDQDTINYLEQLLGKPPK
jgi:hypothetical protein